MLTAIPAPPGSVWYLGPIPLRAYALLIIAGIVVAWWLLDRRYRRKGGPEDASVDVAVWAVVFGILGGRLYHVITDYQLYFGPGRNPVDALRIWNGGLGIWGAIALGALGAYIGARRLGLRLAPIADSLVPGLLAAQAIGRFGNYFNQELFGAPTTLPWGLQVDAEHIPDGYALDTLFHPTFLYESLWSLAGICVLLWAEKRFDLRGGQLFAAYLMWYTAGRFWIEALRIDTAHHILGLRLNMWTSLLVFLLGLSLLILLRRRLAASPDADAIYLPEHGSQAREGEDDGTSSKDAEADEVHDEANLGEKIGEGSAAGAGDAAH